MCLPKGVIQAGMKTISITILIIAVFYAYSLFSQFGFAETVGTYSIILLFILTMMMQSSCTYMTQDRPGFVNSCCTVFLGFVVMLGLFFVWNLFFLFFDEKKNCYQIAKESSLLKQYMDRSMDEAYYLGIHTLCSKNCPCQVNNSTMQEFFQKNSQKMNQTLYFDDEGAKNVVECPEKALQLANFTDSHYQSMVVAAQYETMFNSSGYCAPFDRFLFTDINKGVPIQNNFNIFRVLVRSQVSIYITTIFLLFALLGCNNCCICCLNWRSRSQNNIENLIKGQQDSGEIGKNIDEDILKAKEYLKKKKQLVSKQTEDEDTQQENTKVTNRKQKIE